MTGGANRLPAPPPPLGGASGSTRDSPAGPALPLGATYPEESGAGMRVTAGTPCTRSRSPEGGSDLCPWAEDS